MTLFLKEERLKGKRIIVLKRVEVAVEREKSAVCVCWGLESNCSVRDLI